jgi:hypothetical protein
VGRFVLLLTLVQEHIAWFDDLSALNSFRCPVEVAVDASSEAFATS